MINNTSKNKFNFIIKKKIIGEYEYTAMIIEPRKHKAMEFVLKNFMDNLDNRWCFVIFCSDFNLNFIFNIIKKFDIENQNRIKIVRFTENNINRIEYSWIMIETNIYDFINTEMFLVFQTDSIILNKNIIYEFMSYDYVGAPFNRNQKWRRRTPQTDFYDVGNGGLSLRRKSKMIEIINTRNHKEDKGEDTFFSYYKNINKPCTSKAQEFSIETTYYEMPFGIHKIWDYLSKEDVNKLINIYPEIKTLILLQK